MVNKNLVKTVAVASLVAISSVNLFGCIKSSESEAVSIQVEQDATGDEVAEVRVETETTKTEQKNNEIMAQFDKIPAELIREPKTPKQEDAVKQDGNQSSGQVVKGSDKNGHPYLQPGAEYTFGTDGMPIEAPAPGTYDITLAPIITNPQTGKEYQYRESKGGRWVDHDEVKKQMAAEDEWERKVRDGEMDAQGNTNLIKMTDEEISELAARAAANFRQ